MHLALPPSLPPSFPPPLPPSPTVAAAAASAAVPPPALQVCGRRQLHPRGTCLGDIHRDAERSDEEEIQSAGQSRLSAASLPCPLHWAFNKMLPIVNWQSC